MSRPVSSPLRGRYAHPEASRDGRMPARSCDPAPATDVLPTQGPFLPASARPCPGERISPTRCEPHGALVNAMPRNAFDEPQRSLSIFASSSFRDRSIQPLRHLSAGASAGFTA
jgi:hypothetical protein